MFSGPEFQILVRILAYFGLDLVRILTKNCSHHTIPPRRIRHKWWQNYDFFGKYGNVLYVEKSPLFFWSDYRCSTYTDVSYVQLGEKLPYNEMIKNGLVRIFGK